MKFCCGVTLYYPSEEELNSIKRYRNAFECIYVFDNTDSDVRFKNEEYYRNDERFIYISYGNNEGLSVAYNTMCKIAITEYFDYIALFDQDSIISNDDLIRMTNYIKKHSRKAVAVYVPEIIYKHKNISIHNENEGGIEEEIEWEISSGSFIDLLIYKRTDGFDENYFIDRLDFDYCVSARKLGYKIVRIRNVFLYQALGEQGKGVFKKVSEHSPIRHYYIFRNRLYYYMSKNKTSNIEYTKLICSSLRHFFKILLFEKCKMDKMKMVYKGLVDYNKGRMGKFLE